MKVVTKRMKEKTTVLKLLFDLHWQKARNNARPPHTAKLRRKAI